MRCLSDLHMTVWQQKGPGAAGAGPPATGLAGSLLRPAHTGRRRPPCQMVGARRPPQRQKIGAGAALDRLMAAQSRRGRVRGIFRGDRAWPFRPTRLRASAGYRAFSSDGRLRPSRWAPRAGLPPPDYGPRPVTDGRRTLQSLNAHVRLQRGARVNFPLPETWRQAR